MEKQAGDKFSKFVRLIKVEDQGDGTCVISGVCTSEARDSDGERCDYKSSKPFYEKWSAGAFKRSGGRSLGNIRAMHGNVAAGKMTAMKFNDPEHEVWIQAHVIDADSAKKCVEGVYTGFSHGGKYVRVWKVGESVGGQSQQVTWYTANPCEVSVVDNPANPEATFDLALVDAPLPAGDAGTFQLVDKTGSVELRKFQAPASVAKAGPVVPPQPKTDPDAMQPDAPNSPEPKPQTGYGLSGHVATAPDPSKKPDADPDKDDPDKDGKPDPAAAVGKLRIECDTTIDGIEKAMFAMEAELTRLLGTNNLELSAVAVSPSSERPATAVSQIRKVNAMTQEEMVKAARNAVAHMARMRKAVSDHADYMGKGFGDLHKILGVEEASSFGADEPQSRGVIPSGATENIQRVDAAEMAKAMVLALKEAGLVKAQEAPAPVPVPVAAAPAAATPAPDAPLTRAEMTEMLKADREEGLNSLLKALVKVGDDPDDDEDDFPPAKDGKDGKKVAKGMGSRSNPAPVANGGPNVRVVPVGKTQDGGVPTAAAASTASDPITADDVIKAASGDREASLKLMRGAQPQSAVPATLVPHLK